ncbi:major facilitator superfamily domain-containing protein [Tribonema minus]|uniref:Major facilitator superfamily domain-containing protein n=1 Tax=Tribonema minus TaxID=303371 RepID=A0A835ZED6_9STRA|nr:major facilitator superfamily domain-containing protein [Tribonema minus]
MKLTVLLAAVGVAAAASTACAAPAALPKTPTKDLKPATKHQLAVVRGGGAAVATKPTAAPIQVSKPTAYLTVGWLGVIGGALCHLALGTTYCWGNFSPYTPPHLRYFGGKPATPGAQPDTLWVLPGAFVAQTLTMPIGPWLQTKLGCRGATLVGCWLMAAGVLLSSYAKSLAAFMFCYSFMFGAGVGIAYTAPMVNGWRWFPGKKGLVSGCVVAGFGAGGFIFNQVGSRIINPSGISAVDGVYPAAIYAAFPVMLRKLALIYFTLTGLGALLVNPPPPVVTAVGAPATAPPLGTSLRDAVRSRAFWSLWLMALLVGTAGINVAGTYKAFGARLHADDQFQSLVGSVAALANGTGRLFWGNMLDAAGFNRPFAALVTLQAATMAAYTTLARSRAGFAAATCAILFCLGGNFAMFPAVTTKIFGVRHGALIYGVLFSAFSIASVSGTFITKALVANFGWDGVFKTMSVLSVLVLAVLSTFTASFAA